MAAGEIHVNDIGTVLNFTIKNQDSEIVDVSNASVKQLWLLLPNGTLLIKSLGFITDGTDGGVTYTIASGDLSIPGIYRFQCYVKIGSAEYNSDINSEKVYPNLV